MLHWVQIHLDYRSVGRAHRVPNDCRASAGCHAFANVSRSDFVWLNLCYRMVFRTSMMSMRMSGAVKFCNWIEMCIMLLFWIEYGTLLIWHILTAICNNSKVLAIVADV